MPQLLSSRALCEALCAPSAIADEKLARVPAGRGPNNNSGSTAFPGTGPGMSGRRGQQQPVRAGPFADHNHYQHGLLPLMGRTEPSIER
jgi:hypothetical protein